MDASNVGSQTTFAPGLCSTQVTDCDDNSQTPTTSRAYKLLIQKIIKKDLESATAAEFDAQEKECLLDIMQQADTLFNQSNTAHELLLDARLYKHIARICRQYAEEISLNQKKFHVSEFAEKLANKMGSNFSESGSQKQKTGLSARKWTKFSKVADPVFNRTKYLQSLFSAFPDDEEKEKKTRTPRSKEHRQKGPATKANVVDLTQIQEDQNSSSATDKLVTSTMKQLVAHYQENGREAIDYFRFIIDPQSFGRSIENAFYVSFLIKEGKAGIFYDEETGLPKIKPRKSRQDPTQGQVLTDKKQVLLTLTMSDWQNQKDALQLEQAMIRR